jgi:rod shape determining protein RodA
MKPRVNFRDFDKLLFLTPLLIFTIGILSIYSASFKANQNADQTFVVRQLLWMGVGALFVFLIVRVNYFKLMDFAWPIYILAQFFLILVLFMPARLGAHRWIDLGGFNFQPSELAKLSVVFVLAHFFASHKIEKLSRWKWAIPFAIVFVPFLLILKEPDLGTGLVLIPVLLAMLYLWGVKPKVLLGLIVFGLFLAPFLFHFLKDYQRARLLVFINPNMDPLGAGYTIIQSKIAIGSGGLFGKGFLSGTQNQLNFIPERHTDFIFAVIAEEGGFAASALVMLLFWVIVRKGFLICHETPDRFGMQLAGGITVLLWTQVFINLGMTMGLLPVVGMPLPLVSYGGSSVVMTMLAIGLLLNIKMHRPLF